MGSSKVGFRHGKLLSCVFLNDVPCSHRKSEKFSVMSRCFECGHYKRFMEEMEEEDIRDMEEIDREREELEREELRRENRDDVLDEIERKYVRKKWGSGVR